MRSCHKARPADRSDYPLDVAAEPAPKSDVRRAAARCWARRLVWIHECLPLNCPKCGEPKRIIAFVLDRPTIERVLERIGDRAKATADWPQMDQAAGRADGWIDGRVGGVGQSSGARRSGVHGVFSTIPCAAFTLTAWLRSGAAEGWRFEMPISPRTTLSSMSASAWPTATRPSPCSPASAVCS